MAYSPLEAYRSALEEKRTKLMTKEPSLTLLEATLLSVRSASGKPFIDMAFADLQVPDAAQKLGRLNRFADRHPAKQSGLSKLYPNS